LNLKPENVRIIIFVGDQNRVENYSQFFIVLNTQENSKPKPGFQIITVMSTGYWADNIDIVINERCFGKHRFRNASTKRKFNFLNIIRIELGSLQADIPVDSFVLSKFGLQDSQHAPRSLFD
jgi:uridine phosphorylase